MTTHNIKSLVERLRDQQPVTQDMNHTMQGDLMDEAATALTDLQAENDKLNAAIKRQSGAAKTLRASIMAEVQHLKDMDRGEYFAAKSLESEREANSILTAERDAWKARAEAAEVALAETMAALSWSKANLQSLAVQVSDQERNYLHLYTAAYDVWRWFEVARPELIGPRAEALRDAVMGPRPYGSVLFPVASPADLAKEVE